MGTGLDWTTDTTRNKGHQRRRRTACLQIKAKTEHNHSAPSAARPDATVPSRIPDAQACRLFRGNRFDFLRPAHSELQEEHHSYITNKHKLTHECEGRPINRKKNILSEYVGLIQQRYFPRFFVKQRQNCAQKIKKLFDTPPTLTCTPHTPRNTPSPDGTLARHQHKYPNPKITKVNTQKIQKLK